MSAVPIAVLVLVLLLPTLGLPVYWSRQLMLVAVFALVVSGLNLTWGYAGELALGQVAFFAVGAYATAILRLHDHTDLLLAAAVSMAAAGVLGFLASIPALRMQGWPLALASFFLVLLIPDVIVVFERWTQGLRGIVGVFNPSLLGVEIARQDLYVVVMLFVAACFLVLRNLIQSRYGLALQVMKESNQLAESLGLGVGRLRFSAYVIGAMPPGLAGCLYAYLLGIVLPSSFSLSLVITIVAASVVGGTRSIWGAPIGALVLVLGQTQTASFENYSLIFYGIFVVLMGAVFRGGLADLGRWAIRRLAKPDARRAVGPSDADDVLDLTLPGQRLEVEGLFKSFGGLNALRGGDLRAEPGEITALIGPNGAGKTTMLNAISGFIRADSGSIRLGGRELSGLKSSTIARAGVGRTFQTPHIPTEMTALEVVESGRLRDGRLGVVRAVLRLPGFWRTRRSDRAAAMSALRFADLEALADQDARALPLGTRRLLEVVRAVAGVPAVLLLDEPAAGLDDDALERLKELLRRVKAAGATIVIIEHNVPFVMSLADTVWVLDLGKPLAHGTPDEVSTDETVIATYLGRRHGTVEDSDRDGVAL
ncbi:ABC transporter permease subunit [Spirillospora sp. CA-255316]